MTVSTRNGFTCAPLSTPNNSLTLWPMANNVTLFTITLSAAVARVPGDANGDRAVDFNDLVILAQNYNTTGGMTWDTGDFTGDGNVDFSDLVALAQNYNTSLAAPAAAAPAPA